MVFEEICNDEAFRGKGIRQTQTKIGEKKNNKCEGRWAPSLRCTAMVQARTTLYEV